MVELGQHVAGRAVVEIRNAARDAAMRLQRVQIVELPDEGLYLDHTPAEGTLGVGAQDGWLEPFEWNSSRHGATLAVRVTGHRVGGPTMTVEFPFRIGPDGRLVSLSAPSRQLQSS